MTDTNIEKIKNEIAQIDWEQELRHDTVEENFNIFHGKLITTIDSYAPEKEITINAKKIIK